MARRDRELALRIRLDGSTTAVVGRTGVHFIRGGGSFFLDGRAARKIGEVYASIAELGFDAAIARQVDPAEAAGADLPGAANGSNAD